MRNLTASLMAMVVYSLVVFLPSNSYAFSYEMKRFPFRLIESDEFDSSIRNMVERYEKFKF